MKLEFTKDPVEKMISNAVDYVARVLMFADLHLDDYGDPLFQDPKGKFSERINALAEVIAYAADKGISHIYCLGDFFHARTKLSIPLLNLVSRIFKESFLKYGVTFVLLKGNHDTYIKDVSSSSISVFEGEGIEIIDEPVLFKSLGMLAIPFGSEKSNKTLPSEILTIMHTEFEGAVNNGYKVMKSDMKSSQFKGVVLTGHYHQSQLVSDNVYYLGSLLQQDFAERDNETGFYDCLLFKSKVILKKHFIDSPKYYYVDFEKMEGFPKDYVDSYVRVFVEKENFDRALNSFTEKGLYFRSLDIREKIKEGSSEISIKEEKEIETDAIGKYLEHLQVPESEIKSRKDKAEEILNEIKEN